MTKTKMTEMTTVYFDNNEVEFLGLDFRPEDCDGILNPTVASPSQIAKIKRALADGVRYEVQYVLARFMRPATVRVRTFGTYKGEARQAIHHELAEMTEVCQRILHWTDRLAGGDTDSVLTMIHEGAAENLPAYLYGSTGRLAELVNSYVDRFGPQKTDAQTP